MKGPPSTEPSLDDILARDFAELKVGEGNLPAPEPTEKKNAASTTASVPKAYNQRIDAVEQRTSFAVKPPAPSNAETVDKTPASPKPEVLKSPSAQPGDDFDVNW